MSRRPPKNRTLRQSAAEGQRRSGRVKWFSETRGYGFAVADDDPSTDLFLHHSAIQLSGFRVLAEGQRICFTVSAGAKGPVALNVVPIANDR